MTEKIKDIFNSYTKRKNDEEFLQALTRFILFMLMLTILSIFYPHYFDNDSIKYAFGAFFIFMLIHTFWLVKKSKTYFFRRLSAIFADTTMVTYTIYKLDLHAIFVYPILLWIVMGNGIRFGEKYFYIALIYALGTLSGALYLNPFWSSNLDLSLALIIGLLTITLFNTKTLKRIQQLNNTLEKKVAQRVRQLEYEYFHDSLTGLQNTMALEHHLKSEAFSGLMVIDIDGFRNINELYGMNTGNHLLKSFAKSLEEFFKDKDLDFYRIYGDVFALRGKFAFIDHDIYEDLIEEILEYVDSLNISSTEIEDSIKLDITIGLSLEEEDALNKAEMALSFAKSNAKKFIAYSKMIDTSKTIHQLLQRKSEIKDAINSDNFIPVFQPIVDREQKVVKYESLIRMRKIIDGKTELISPFFFLDAAIKTKQYEALTIIMIEKSFEIMKALQKPFSLNLSFNDLMNENVLEKLKQNIEKYKIGNQLTVEILESENIEDYRVINNFIKEFKALGVQIAIDDFGSGFSNFTHVFELEPDILKIDGSLIKNIDIDKKSYEFVKSIVQLAKALEIKTLAEFVGSKEIFEITHELGIDYFQGYYFCEPIPKEELTKELEPSS